MIRDNISRTSRNLTLSEASIRYELPGGSTNGCASVADIASSSECQGAEVSPGIVDVYPKVKRQ